MQHPVNSLDRDWILGLLCLLCILGCGKNAPEPELMWGKRGLQNGDFIRPRAATIGLTSSGEEELYIIDFTGRIQVFDLDGHYKRSWRTPSIEQGRPVGCTWSKKNKLIVADSHYQRLLIYTPDGQLRQEIKGTQGEGNLGPFGYVADVAEDAEGNLYVSEFGNVQTSDSDQDRIRKLSPEGSFILSWGVHGNKEGEFGRPYGLAISEAAEVYVADSCNHRIQVFDLNGKFQRSFGSSGQALGDMQYPKDVALGPKNTVYVAEWGNHRVHKFTTDGQPLGTWGKPGREPGCLNQPWGLIVSKDGTLFVLDSDNNRVQRVRW
jgi:DNA-binding beta-propeller fold protein YncE